MTAAKRDDSRVFLPKVALDALIRAILDRGYELIGPTVADGAIIYDHITSVEDLPQGWTDLQQPGHYELVKRDDDRWFSYAVGPHSWKRHLFPPWITMFTAERGENGWAYHDATKEPPRYAFLGVRACELAAIAVQDRTLRDGDYADANYVARRERALLIAVHCAEPAATCFCTSMKTGPSCTSGFDLALTELDDGFVVDIGTPRGGELLSAVESRPVTKPQRRQATETHKQAVDKIERRLPTEGLRELLMANLEHPQWEAVAERCLSCANCTMVCPTCFCVSFDEVSDLRGERVERRRKWDSCFDTEFSYMNGGIVRDQIRWRYRQWLTHKLSTWHDQFGVSGCVGCGRCITWCPVGIDLTAEVAAIREQAP